MSVREWPKSAPVYLLLCRHGKTRGTELDDDLIRMAAKEDDNVVVPPEVHHRALTESPAPDEKRSLSVKGLAETRDVVRVLTETLRRPWSHGGTTSQIIVSLLLSADSNPAVETARIMAQAVGLAENRLRQESGLSSSHFYAIDARPALGRELASLSRETNVTGWSALLVVGHQPHLSWLTTWLLATPWNRRRWTVPFNHSEVACFLIKDVDGLGKRLIGGGRVGEPEGLWPRIVHRAAATPRPWHAPAELLWTITANDQATADLVRDKIKSKMDTAKLLGAGIIAGLGFVFGVLLDPTKVAGHPLAVRAAAAALLVGLVLYLTTIYAYDTLLMPTRFWGERKASPGRHPRWLVHRPPSSAAWVLYQNMVRIWYGMFTPATVAALGGLILLGYAALVPGNLHWFPAIPSAIQIIALIALAAVTARIAFRFRPVLGAED